VSAAPYLAKAEQAAASARVLLAAGDLEGAANRAYYAMFHAARAALLKAGESAVGSHGTIIGKFGLTFVKSGVVSVELGRAINEAQRLRSVGDYGPEPLGADAVRSMVKSAGEFVETVRRLVDERSST
jgi:uncharacterized protein (UPF0332 family)